MILKGQKFKFLHKSKVLNKIKILFKNNLFLYSTVVLMIMILFTSLYFALKFKKNGPVESSKTQGHIARQENPENQKHVYYTSEMFKYVVDYPESLKVDELGSGGGYINFVRFEETGVGNYKGFAIGVSEQKIDNEISRIKKAFIDDGGVLAEETNITLLDGTSAKALYFKPKDPSIGDEDRTVVIFAHGKYSYSISTIPYQLNDILSRFTFTD